MYSITRSAIFFVSCRFMSLCYTYNQDIQAKKVYRMNHIVAVLFICGCLFAVGITLVINAFRTSVASSNTLFVDDRYWYNPFIYNNPDDPALFVPRRSGWGQTLNFGHPKSRQLFIGIVVILLGFVGLSFLPLGPSMGCHLSGCHSFP
jgi:uncharacterized membrane protein